MDHHNSKFIVSKQKDRNLVYVRNTRTCFDFCKSALAYNNGFEMNMSVNLRSSASGCFVPPLPKKECFKHSMRYSGCLIWNCLPDNVKSSQTAETFHNRCIKWLTQ